MNKYLKMLLYPIVFLRRKHDHFLMVHNPEKLFSIYYRRNTGNCLDLDNPKTLYDKIAYMAFRTDTTVWSQLADKVRVREYVSQKGYSNNLPKLFGTWECGNDIDFEMLPRSFVIKTNNGSATNILVKDKRTIDFDLVRKQIDIWLRIDYGLKTCQPHYSRIKPLILAEEFLGDGRNMLNDYKFYCNDGNPLFVQVMTDRIPNTHNIKLSIMDMNWISHPEYCGKFHEQAAKVDKPKSFEEMKQMAGVLSKGFPFVRVDFYDINGHVVFGEMTFTPGFDTINETFNRYFGLKVDISKLQ